MMTGKDSLHEGIIDRAMKHGRVDFLISIEKLFAEFVMCNHWDKYGEEASVTLIELAFHRFYDNLEEIAASNLLRSLWSKSLLRMPFYSDKVKAFKNGT